MAEVGGSAFRAAITAGQNVVASGANGSQSYGIGTTVTAYGGSPSYSYDWEYVSGDVQISAVSDTSATTTWQSNGTDEIFSSVWRCKVTDSASRIVYSDNVSIEFTHGTPP